jgi:hypothetical protein
MATGTLATTARQAHVQQVGYCRFVVNYNDPGISVGVGKQYLPAGAIIIGTDVLVTASFNANSTNVLTVGVNGTTANNIVGSADVNEASVQIFQNISASATLPLTADTQVYAKFAQTGATAATSGKAYVIIKYIPDNDL